MASTTPASVAPQLSRHVADAADSLHDRGWTVIEDFVRDDFVRALRAEAEVLHAAGGFRPAGVGRGDEWRLDRRLRGDEVAWVDLRDPLPCQAQLLSVMEQLRRDLNRRLMLGLLEYECHIAVYPPGAFYRRHRDHFRGTEARKLTTTLYLNEAWSRADGGQIRLFVPDADPVDVLPRGGTLVLFLSHDLDHEVLAATRRRWSWTGWYKQRS